MKTTSDRILGRLVPALLTAAGLGLVAAGLLTYTNPVAATDPSPSPSPVVTPAPSVVVSPTPSPDGSASPSPSAPPERAFATRIVIAGLRIDLPVIELPGPPTYPPCDVAMYIEALAQPGEPGATYISAHAREGMFLPLLTESRRSDGERMLGMLVQVYTSDDVLHLYEITEVRPFVLFEEALVEPIAARTEQLWLQTSISGPAPPGVPNTKPKMQVIAMPLSTSPADPAQAHPTPKPVACG